MNIGQKQKEDDAQLPGAIRNNLFRNRRLMPYDNQILMAKTTVYATVEHLGRASKVFLGFVILYPYCKDMPCVDGSFIPPFKRLFPHMMDGNYRKSCKKKDIPPVIKKITRHTGNSPYGALEQQHFRFFQSKAVNSTSPHAAT